jgi:hypothetical protein
VLISRASLMRIRIHATKDTPGGDAVADRRIDAVHVVKDEMHEPRKVCFAARVSPADSQTTDQR